MGGWWQLLGHDGAIILLEVCLRLYDLTADLCHVPIIRNILFPRHLREQRE